MTITAPTAVLAAASTATASGSANLVTKTTVAVSPGKFVIGIFGSPGSDSFTSVTDSAGNKWNITQAALKPSLSAAALVWSFITKNMPIGTSFTATETNATTWNFDGGWQVSGVGFGKDFSATGFNTTTTNVGVTQAITKLTFANEIIFGQTNTVSSVTFVESVGFTNLFGVGSGNGGMGYKIVAATTTSTYAPTFSLGNSQLTWQVVSFPAYGTRPLPKLVRATRGFNK